MRLQNQFSILFLCLSITVSIRKSSCNTPLCISLGSFCSSAWALREIGLRKEAYPFDWIVSPFSALYTCLEDDFNNFLNDLEIDDKKSGVLDYYGFHYLHDWPTEKLPSLDIQNTDEGTNRATLVKDWKDFSPAIRKKYLKRIVQFKYACNSGRKIFFIRSHGTTKEQAILLKTIIEKRYPGLDFHLIVVSENASTWDLEKITNFSIPINEWNQISLWINIFTNCGITTINVSDKKLTQDSEVIHVHCNY